MFAPKFCLHILGYNTLEHDLLRAYNIKGGTLPLARLACRIQKPEKICSSDLEDLQI